MAHNIFGERAAFRNGAAWHGLGKSLDGADGRATTAIEIAEVDFPISTQPLQFPYQGGMIFTSQVAIVRPPVGDETGPQILGYASNEYEPITNREVATLLDPLTDEWPCETVGALGKGEGFFVTLKAGMTTVAGDDVAQYFFIWNKHDGTGSLKIMFTPVRVVCQNTCIMGEQASTISANVIHTKRVHEEAQFAVNLLPVIRNAQEKGIENLNRFSKITLKGEQIKRIAELVYPLNPPSTRAQQYDQLLSDGVELPDEEIIRLANAKISLESQHERAQRMRLELYKRTLQFNEDRPQYANTAWALYNAVTELECWRNGGKDERATLAATLVGDRAATMRRAYDVIADAIAIVAETGPTN